MRTPLDQYPTPEWQTKALLRRVPITGTVLEPCSGDRYLSKVIARTIERPVITNDIDPKYDANHHLDATLPFLWSAVGNVDWVVTNPPFNVAMEILQRSYECARLGVAFLLRLSFLEPTEESKRGDVTYPERSEWLAAHPPAKLIVLPRWKYNAESKGTDSCTTAWMVWHTGREFHYTKPLEVVSKREMRELMR